MKDDDTRKRDAIGSLLQVPAVVIESFREEHARDLENLRLFDAAIAAELTEAQLSDIFLVAQNMGTLDFDQAHSNSRETLELAIQDPVARQIISDAAEKINSGKTNGFTTDFSKSEEVRGQFPNPEAIKAAADSVRKVPHAEMVASRRVDTTSGKGRVAMAAGRREAAPNTERS